MTAIGTAPTEIEIAIRYSDDELFGEDAYRLRRWAWEHKIHKKLKNVLFACGYTLDDVFQNARLFSLVSRPTRDFALTTAIVNGLVWSVYRLVRHLRHPKRVPPSGRFFPLIGDIPDRELEEYEAIHSIDLDARDLARSISNQRLRDIIDWRYGLSKPEMTLAECGAKLGLTRERVRQLEEKALEKLRQRQSAWDIAESLGWNDGIMPPPEPPSKMGRPRKKRDPVEPRRVSDSRRAYKAKLPQKTSAEIVEAVGLVRTSQRKGLRRKAVLKDVDSIIMDAILRKMEYQSAAPCCGNCQHFTPEDRQAFNEADNATCVLNPAFAVPVSADGVCKHFEAKK